MREPSETPPAALLEIATDASHRAGKLLLDGMGSSRHRIQTKSSATDMVTEVDRSSEAMIVSTIHQQRPDDAILAEEGSSRSGSTGIRWIIDPLDGTTNYLYGLPVFAVSIAVETGSRVVAGVVHDPCRDETFTALEGRGAWCNGTPTRPTDLADLSAALVGTGFSYDSGRRAEQASLLTKVIPSIRDIRRAGAAALDLCWVAAGRLDAFFESGLQPWDSAAGLLVARESGARAFELPVEPRPRVLTVASAPGIAAGLRALLASALAT